MFVLGQKNYPSSPRSHPLVSTDPFLRASLRNWPLTWNAAGCIPGDMAPGKSKKVIGDF